MATHPTIQAVLPKGLRQPARWLPLRALGRQAALQCIDGRQEGCYLAAPGGGLGEFLLLLAAAERVQAEPLSQAAVRALLATYAEALGPVHLHSDQAALQRVCAAVHAAPVPRGMPARPEAGCEAAWLQRPPTALQPRLLHLLLQPEHVGCGHIAAMLREPAAYGTRRGLVAAGLRAFYLLHWQGGFHTHLDVLHGAHAEQAVVTLDTRQPLRPETPVPAYCAREQDGQYFVHHLAARRFLHALQRQFLRDQRVVPALAGLPQQALAEAQEALAATQLEATLARLAPNLPRVAHLIEALPPPAATDTPQAPAPAQRAG